MWEEGEKNTCYIIKNKTPTMKDLTDTINYMKRDAKTKEEYFGVYPE